MEQFYVQYQPAWFSSYSFFESHANIIWIDLDLKEGLQV